MLRRYRHLSRYRQVVNTFVRNGFGHLVGSLGLGEVFSRRVPPSNESLHLSAPQRLVKVLEELGPTFIKIGQILSTRVDVLPKEYVEELTKLQDHVPAMTREDVTTMLTKELGSDYSQAFSQFDWEPIASASIGQVHWAKLVGGKEVAVKIQRINIASSIETDLEILFDLANFLHNKTTWAKQYGILDIMDKLATSLHGELNYAQEGRNGDRFSSNFLKDQKVIFPKILWEYTTDKVLIMEFIHSVKISNKEELISRGWNVESVAKTFVLAMVKQIFIHGFFHADPHPGNVGVKDGQVVFMDFGQVGKVDEWSRNKYVSIIVYLIRQDVQGIVTVLTDFGAIGQQINRSKLESDILKLRDKYYQISIDEIEVGKALRELLSIVQEHKIKVPSELGLISKALMTMEGVVHQLHPNLSIVEIAEPLGKEMLANNYNWHKLPISLGYHLMETGKMSLALPKKLYNMLNQWEAGQGKMQIELVNMEKLMLMLNIASNRISLSIVLASIIIGSSLNFHPGTGLLVQLPLVELGFIVAVFIGIWLVIYILRGGKY